MDYLSGYYNDDVTGSIFHRDPDLRCCSYLAYPESDESVYGDSEIQLKLCIMELYDFLYNKNNSLIKENQDFQHSELLKIITEISSIISVCIETKVDIKDSIDVQNSQVQRLTEQKRNIERIGETVGNNNMLIDIVDKISSSIQNKLFCLSKIVNTVEQFSLKQEEFYDNEYGLTPLKIKYPYLTGTYTQLNYNNIPNSPQTTYQYQESKVNINKETPDNIGMNLTNIKEYVVNNDQFNQYEYKKGYQILQEAERNAMIKLRNRKNANLQAAIKDTSKEEEYHIVKDDHLYTKNQQDYNQLINNTNSNNQEEEKIGICDKFSGGTTRLIIDNNRIKKSNGKDSLLCIDGWGLIEHHKEDTPVSPKYKCNNLESEDESSLDLYKDNKLLINRKYKLNINNNKEESNLSDYGSGNTNTTETKYSRRINKSKEKYINKGDSSCEEDNNNNSTKNVRKLRNKFEKDLKSHIHWEIEREEDNMKLHEEFEEWEIKEDNEKKATMKNNNNNNNIISNKKNGDKMICTESNRRNKIKLEYSGSTMPSQYTNTNNRQLSNYRDTMYSTSSWLPLSRNTGFNYNCLYSNSDKNSNKQSGSEYNPAAEYARFSDAVGKVINPIVADESYRDNGKNIMNPKKLFNVKFGTLTEDTFKEIQEKLRLKMEGWTIHGSGLQDPRANLFWDPAVMTAASSVSPFYTNMPSSNSPLLINTLIPASNGIPKRSGFLESIDPSRFSLHKSLNRGEDKPDFILRSSDLQSSGSTSPKNPLSHSRSSSPKTPQTNTNINRTFSSNSKSIPIKSMRELSRRRRNN
ncbi:unnamed protein product [Cryptosporidium hominis]|uniref:Uncharacterized protein n=2 Tax=Cryptosporidium hominis TaxID=237895 RepID=A0A0S4TKT7_CRYHO|nr:hypothetical protein ChTU502y2012_405g0705 [Cryptosporidium hominis]PPA64529.1 hypothetical protein ChUKH1_07530 [Cryptosporidium hominis]PPS98018.1 Uncharacterized protein GY17_00000895 [Cryptosporidium hominis]CUV08000.1 unnamed protein product [Cryptosporidium hominis]|eukprot:PPS98018.1 Uncharacterized protein GY17_00000895 [Cryptosporidium hominis]